MKHFIIPVLLSVLLPAYAAAGDQATLTGIRYNIQPDRSRVTLQFTGEPEYTTDERGDGVILRFRNATVAPKPGAARLTFVSGAVEKVSVHRIGEDSLAVIIDLRDNCHYALHAGADGALIVDAFRPGNLVQARRSTVAKKDPVPADHIPAVHKVTPVVAPDSLLAVSDSATVTEETPLKGDTAEAVNPVLLAFSAVLALACSTALGWMYIRYRRFVGRAVRTTVTVPATVDVPPDTPVDDEPVDSRPALRIPSAPLLDEADAADGGHGDDEDVISSTAGKFGRSKGEIGFAVHKKESLTGQRLTKKLSPAAVRTMTKTQRIALARKLGVGVGELDLMARLHNDTEEQ